MGQCIQLQLGDCTEQMRNLPSNCVRAIITDPPYGLEFIGKSWDAPWREIEKEKEEPLSPSVQSRWGFQKWATIWLRECHRILQPNGLIKVFSGTRTYHRMSAAMVNAGFQMERIEAWVYGSGFPKSMDISKALGKAAGVQREVIATRKGHGNTGTGRYNWDNPDDTTDRSVVPITEPATDLAKKYKGYGTTLKPAWEPFLVGRKDA